VIGGLPPGMPAAFEAAFGCWLVELLEDGRGVTSKQKLPTVGVGSGP
jgi:hypothetical protein